MTLSTVILSDAPRGWVPFTPSRVLAMAVFGGFAAYVVAGLFVVPHPARAPSQLWSIVSHPFIATWSLTDPYDEEGIASPYAPYDPETVEEWDRRDERLSNRDDAPVQPDPDVWMP
jgi:hypothetical protein